MGFDYTIMKWIQAIGGSEGGLWQRIVDNFFIGGTFLCEELFLILVIFIVYWAVNKRLGEYMIITLFGTLGVNSLFKAIVARPRPFLNENFADMRHVEVDNFFVNSTALHLGNSYSFPSGHSQLAGSFFGGMALAIKKRAVTIVMMVLVLIVMLSRVYLGVHYPTDVIVGGIVGLIVAYIMYKVFNKYYDKKLLIIIALFALLVITLIVELATKATSAGDTAKMMGLAGGGIAGFILESKKINFKVDGVLWKRILRVAIGFGLVIALRMGLKEVFEMISSAESLTMIFDIIRYAILGFFALGVWPLIFTKIKL